MAEIANCGIGGIGERRETTVLLKSGLLTVVVADRASKNAIK